MLVTFNFYLPNEDHTIICEKDSRNEVTITNTSSQTGLGVIRGVSIG
jgi:hypothetical protein